MNPQFSLCAHIGMINDFMMSTNFHKGLFEYYRQRPVRFVDFLANPSNQAYFFKKFTSYVHYLVLVDSFFLRLCFSTSNANMLV